MADEVVMSAIMQTSEMLVMVQGLAVKKWLVRSLEQHQMCSHSQVQ